MAQLATQASMTDLRHQGAQACIDLIRGQPVGRALYWLNAAYTGPQGLGRLRVIRPSRLRAGLAFADLARCRVPSAS